MPAIGSSQASNNPDSDQVAAGSCGQATSITTLNNSDPAPSSSSGDVHLYCYCQQPGKNAETIGCDNPNCSIEWSHTLCLKLKQIPLSCKGYRGHSIHIQQDQSMGTLDHYVYKHSLQVILLARLNISVSRTL